MGWPRHYLCHSSPRPRLLANQGYLFMVRRCTPLPLRSCLWMDVSVDGYRERLAKERCPGRRRSQSDPTSSAHPPVNQFPSSQPVQRSVSCYEESVSTPESFFAFCLPHQRSNTDERLAKVALLSEVRRSLSILPAFSLIECSSGDALHARHGQRSSCRLSRSTHTSLHDMT